MIGEIFRRNRIGILATYGVLAFENLLFALYPYLFGKSIDGLIMGNSRFFSFYIAIFFVGIMVGVARRMFDTRIFSKVWKKVSTDVIYELMNKNIESSKVITRAGLSSRYVDLFEYHIPDFFRGAVSLVISIVMLWIAVPAVIGWVMLISFFTLMLNNYVSIRRKKYDHIIMDTVDLSNKAIQDNDRDGVMDAFESRTSNYVKMSDLDAGGWGASDLSWLGTEMIVVLCLIRMDCTTGVILSTVSYVGLLYRNIMTVSIFFRNIKSIEVANEKIGECHADE